MQQEEQKGLRSRANKERKGQIGKNYLLIIGINTYSNDIPNLYNAVKDADAFKAILIEKYQFEEAYCTTLFNEKATRKAILKIFDKLIDCVRPTDNLIFYFSGHGEWAEAHKRGYWLPADAESGERSTYLSNAEVLDFIKLLKARHVFGLVDSCFSESLFVQKNNTILGRQFFMPSRWLLTAGRLEPVSDGLRGRNSPFAKRLLVQLRENTKDMLWVGDLCRAVLHGMEYNEAQQLPRGEALFGVGHEGGEFAFLGKKATFDQLEKAETESMLPITSRQLEPSSNAKNTPSFEDKIQELEQKGLQTQIDLLTRKLVHLKEALILEVDPERQFIYQTRIEEQEKKLETLKRKLQ